MNVVVLAAGNSTRMGMPKGLVVLPDGRTLLDYQLSMLQGMQVTLVVAATHYTVPAHVRVVVNPTPEHGPFSSLQCALQTQDTFVLPIDVPCPTRHVFDQLNQGVAAIPTYQGKGGHPVYLSAQLVQQIKRLPPTDRLDRILREVATRIEVDAPEVVMNLNSPDALAAALNQGLKRRL